MPGKLTITVGIPGSGKTTEADQIQEREGRERVQLVCRDDLRHLLYRGEGTLPSEQAQNVIKIEKMIVKEGLRAGKHVVVHDLNLPGQQRTSWAKVAFNLGAEFVIKDLTHVPLEDCIKRVEQRNALGGRFVRLPVVRELHTKFVGPLRGKPVEYPGVQVEPVVFSTVVRRPELPSAILVDIDGTIASHEGIRSPYDPSRYQYDVPREDVVKFVQDQHYKLGKQIVFCSGRHQDYREVTEEWIYKHVKVPFTLVMRENKTRDDSVEKYLLFDKYIRPYWNPEFVLDDRDRVVKMWRGIGLPCYQVQEGDF